MITIVDYGLGNIRAFLNVYKRLNIDGEDRDDAPTSCAGATKVILPGVGAFDHAMELLDAVRACARRSTIWCSSSACRCSASASACRCSRARSDEGQLPGLGWIDGRRQALRRR